MLASITTSSLSGRFGREPQRAAERSLAAGLIHNVSSDAHNLHGSPPGLREHLEQAGLAEQAPWLTELVPRAIVSGNELPPAPSWPAAPLHGWRSRLRG
jgi:tyrosine-protein phosphatase YwqE